MCESPTERQELQLESIISRTYGIRNIRSQDYSFPGTFVPMMELPFLGPFVPWNIRSLDRSFHGTFVPWNCRSRYPGPFLPQTVRALHFIFHSRPSTLALKIIILRTQ